MSARAITDLSGLCIHTITHKPWTIEQSARKFAEAGVAGITVWRDAITGKDIRETGKFLRSLGLQIISLCRGGFFPSLNPEGRAAAIDENKKAIDEASELEAPMLVLVCGAAPGQSLDTSREQIRMQHRASPSTLRVNRSGTESNNVCHTLRKRVLS
jgi:sugar phosphate isomerase/epimerase